MEEGKGIVKGDECCEGIGNIKLWVLKKVLRAPLIVKFELGLGVKMEMRKKMKSEEE